MEGLEGPLLTIITASTPLLLAALGELVTERSGVLNLGIEGMMAVGAVCGFAAGYVTGEPIVGMLAAILAGMAMAALFGVVTLIFVANQVASGLALTLFGLGLSALIGNAFVGIPGLGVPAYPHPGPLRYPARRSAGLRSRPADLCRHRHRHRRVVVPVPDAGRADPARGRRQPRLGPCARLWRRADPVPGGAVRRRLRRAGGRLPVARLHAAMDRQHDRRARLDRAGPCRLRGMAAGAASCSARCSSARSATSLSTFRPATSPFPRNSCRCCRI